MLFMWLILTAVFTSFGYLWIKRKTQGMPIAQRSAMDLLFFAPWLLAWFVVQCSSPWVSERRR